MGLHFSSHFRRIIKLHYRERERERERVGGG